MLGLGARAAAIIMAAAAMSVGPPSPHAGAGEDRLPVKIAVIPNLDAGPLLLAKQQGLFEKHGLAADINPGGSGATIIPTVLSGEYGIGYANVISDLIAIDRGLPLVLLHATYGHPAKAEDDPYRVYVDPAGPIKDPRQLASANIGTVSIRNIAEWTTRKSLDNLGATDHSKLRWTRVSGDDAISAVKAGQIDAVWFSEPSGARAAAAGLVPILFANSGSLPGAVGGYFITSKAYAAANPEVIRRFNAVIVEANQLATQRPDAVRDVVIKELRFDRDIVYAAKLNTYPADPAVDKLATIAADLVRYQFIKKIPDPDTIFWKQP